MSVSREAVPLPMPISLTPAKAMDRYRKVRSQMVGHLRRKLAQQIGAYHFLVAQILLQSVIFYKDCRLIGHRHQQ